jgi:prevent-host-death family protein
MIATVVDLRRRTKEIIAALDRGESVIITYRGKEKGTIVPTRPKKRRSIAESDFCGMWKDREDMEDVHEYLQRLRKRRRHAV